MFSRFADNFRHYLKLLKISHYGYGYELAIAKIFVLCREMVAHERDGHQLRPKEAELVRLLSNDEILAARCSGLVAGSIFFHENPDTFRTLRSYDKKVQIARNILKRAEMEQKKKDLLEKKRIDFEERDRARIASNPKRVRNPATHHFGWYGTSERKKAEAPEDSAIRKPLPLINGHRPKACSGFYHPDFLH